MSWYFRPETFVDHELSNVFLEINNMRDEKDFDLIKDNLFESQGVKDLSFKPGLLRVSYDPQQINLESILFDLTSLSFNVGSRKSNVTPRKKSGG